MNPPNESATTSRPALDERHITHIQGREFVVYQGVLDMAHRIGLRELRVETLQLPSEDNAYTAICLATAVSQSGETFADVGDANPKNVSRKIAPHILRMASTRAKARALRDLCNIGITCLEELSEDNSGDAFDSNERQSPRRNGNRTHSTSNRNGENRVRSDGNASTEPPANNASENNTRTGHCITDAQRKAVLNLARRRNMGDGELAEMVREYYGSELDSLTVSDASDLIQTLQSRN